MTVFASRGWLQKHPCGKISVGKGVRGMQICPAADCHLRPGGAMSRRFGPAAAEVVEAG
jgi:hypothetical protein